MKITQIEDMIINLIERRRFRRLPPDWDIVEMADGTARPVGSIKMICRVLRTGGDGFTQPVAKITWRGPSTDVNIEASLEWVQATRQWFQEVEAAMFKVLDDPEVPG